MFRCNTHTFHLLRLAERVRLDHVTKPYTPALEGVAAPEPQLAAEWGFLASITKESEPHPHSKSSRPLSSSKSESSESLSSSEMSEDTIRPRTRPSSPQFEMPNGGEVEPFPAFFDDWSLYFGDEKSVGTCKTHCMSHCFHNTCRKTIILDRKRGIDHSCTSTKCNTETLEMDSKTKALIQQATIPSSYDMEKEITISLPIALETIHHLRGSGKLSIHRFLLASPHYTPSTIRNRNRYNTAAKDAEDSVVVGLKRSLVMMLDSLPNEQCSILIRELEDVLLAGTRWDCVKWMQKWVWEVERKTANPRMVREDMAKNEGVRVLVERVEESVRVVVMSLVWWYEEGRKKMRESVGSVMNMRGGLDLDD